MNRVGTAFMIMIVHASAGAIAAERGNVAGVLGATFGEQTAALYGGQVGFNLGDSFSLVGAVERYEDLLTSSGVRVLQERAGDLDAQVTGSLPGTYFGGGVRWTYSTNVAPFFEAELGGTQLSPELVVVSDGQDVTDAVVEATDFSGLRLTFALGFGIRFHAGERFVLETEYEFVDVIAERDLRLSRLSIALGVRF